MSAERNQTRLATYRDVQMQLRSTAHLKAEARIASLEQYLTTVTDRLAKTAKKGA